MKAALFILIPATALLYYPLAFEEFETPKAYALVAFGCFALFTASLKPLKNDRIAQALLLFCVSAGLSTLFSVDWHMSLFGNAKCPMGLFVIMSYFAVYLAARAVLASEKSIERAIDIMLACAAVVAVYGISQALGFDFKQWSGTLKDHTYTRPMSTLGHPNFMANYLAMIAPFVLYRLETCKRRAVPIYGALLVTIIAAIVMSLSRGMILASMVGVVTYFVASKGKVRKAAYIMAAAIVIGAATFAAVPWFRADAITRMEAIVTPGPARQEYPKGAVRIWKQFPWFGSGTDTFEIGFRNQRTAYYWSIEKGGSPHRAHNDFLNVLATQGVFGALASVLLTLAIVLTARRSRSSLGAAAAAGIVVFYAAGLTSFTIIGTGTLFMIFLAILKTQQREAAPMIEAHSKAYPYLYSANIQCISASASQPHNGNH